MAVCASGSATSLSHNSDSTAAPPAKLTDLSASCQMRNRSADLHYDDAEDEEEEDEEQECDEHNDSLLDRLNADIHVTVQAGKEIHHSIQRPDAAADATESTGQMGSGQEASDCVPEGRTSVSDSLHHQPEGAKAANFHPHLHALHRIRREKKRGESNRMESEWRPKS